jgi:hypothetical protein
MEGPAGSLSQQAAEAEGSLTPEAPGRVGSSPDNDGTGRHRQTARVRHASGERATSGEPVEEDPGDRVTGLLRAMAAPTTGKPMASGISTQDSSVGPGREPLAACSTSPRTSAVTASPARSVAMRGTFTSSARPVPDAAECLRRPSGHRYGQHRRHKSGRSWTGQTFLTRPGAGCLRLELARRPAVLPSFPSRADSPLPVEDLRR